MVYNKFDIILLDFQNNPKILTSITLAVPQQPIEVKTLPTACELSQTRGTEITVVDNLRLE